MSIYAFISMKKNFLIIASLALIVALAVGYGVWHKKRVMNPGEVPSSATPVESGTQGAPIPSALKETQEYQVALKIYGTSGYRFQFADCHVAPLPSATLVVKSGMKFMLDNRDNAIHKIVIDSHTYTIGAYDFVLVAAPKNTGTYQVTCDGAGAAKLTVQR